MTRLLKKSRWFLTARSVLILFGIQMILLLASILRDVPRSFNEGIIDGVVLLVIEHARLVNAGIDFLLFSSDYTGNLDLIVGFLALPLVYYLSAIAIATTGRVAYQLGRKQLPS
ncbi:hypothetical protein [Saliphagus sp. LR7]|uniref:hypothetical protein n=1 Tax=Saliphagus sp. LR7 TaxID=2282654 RepID=UPI000DF77194|nr:hypothetical protein [Saliphagus sp. LR7]